MKIFLVAIPLMAAWPAHAASLIGEVVPPYPEGFSSPWGTCVPEGGDICAFTIETLHDASGEVVAILGELPVGDGTVRRSRVMDQMPAPATGPGQAWSLDCGIGGREDPSVIGLVNTDSSTGFVMALDTVWAVRFDTDAKVLEELDAYAVKCILPGS
jgi:hypothetical protein